ncbi:hypothetical protein N0V94_006731 [Neodidymelliopsis sp. IMI 364377]|nr:hypothetical protein N0V94_006731 [Neodidymelliopsis sp. IMI 364377]
MSRSSSRFREIFKPRRSTTVVTPESNLKPALENPTTAGVLSDERSPPQPSLFINAEMKPIIELESTEPDKFGPALNDFSGMNNKVNVKEEVESIGASLSSMPAQGNFPLVFTAFATSNLTHANRPFADKNGYSFKRSIASNIFDDEDSLSAGIREYVESKIAHAFFEHRCNCPPSEAEKLIIDHPADVSRSTLPKKVHRRTNFLNGHRNIGPYAIKGSHFANTAQTGIISIYVGVAFISALLGPKTFCITLWRFGVALLMYLGIARLCD